MMAADDERALDADTGAKDQRVDVLGVGVSATTMSEAVEAVRGWVDGGERRYVCVTSVHGIMESQVDARLLEVHNQSGLTVPDGMPLVWSAHYAGAKRVTRVYGPDLMLAICGLAAERGWRSFFYGGGAGVADRLAARLRDWFPGLIVAGTYTPPFDPISRDEDDAAVRSIDESRADLVWVGLSTPKQELWMAQHVHRFARPAVLIGVGAAFDIHSRGIRPPPRWLGPLGLFWLYRLLQEPGRLWRRYLYNNPRFALEIVRRPPRLLGERASRP